MFFAKSFRNVACRSRLDFEAQEKPGPTREVVREVVAAEHLGRFAPVEKELGSARAGDFPARWHLGGRRLFVSPRM